MKTKKNYTIKEIADDLSVTKSAIQQRMTGKFRERFVSREKISGRMTLIVSREGYLKLKSEIKSRNKVEQADDDVILVLKDQLKKKDEQIAKLQILLNQSQQLQLQQNEKIKLLETSAKKHWWQRLFK